jgi:pilus assembly protein Flp/PilA
MLSHLRAIWTDESGQDLAEYALLLALIAIVVIVAVTALGPVIADVFTTIATSLEGAGG